MKSIENTNSASVAVCIPCLNEEMTVEAVVKEFKSALPEAHIRVYDNNSTDSTADLAKAAGATVRVVRSKGKGRVVRTIFRESEEDLLVVVDGDSTYDVEKISMLLERSRNYPEAMIVAVRQPEPQSGAFRFLHRWGNRLISRIVSWSFGYSLTDVLSGYRIFPRALYKSLALNSQGFDIETEITLQTLALQKDIIEVGTPYFPRPEGSQSKLSTWNDGFLIIRTIAMLVRYFRPLFFFGMLSAVFGIAGLISGLPPILDYIRFQYVYHVPLALLAASLEIIAILLLMVGIVLDSIKYYYHITRQRLNQMNDIS